ncbi:23S rRNA (adenine(2030)-N(6))-methyltransferase RlmJ, partial [Pseudoalteromonas piscicida]|uniref:23S rRNA (adenine(2030)-N(6))-methyltransferase RlmJ n=1 Tax=Pseudoalteromonas piscicida TaxID=43662 RepID=UPI00110AF010
SQEYLQGFASLGYYAGSGSAISDYVALIKSFKEGDKLSHYPGSPQVAEHFLRRQANGWFFELDPKELELLQQNTAHTKSLRFTGSD